MPAANTLPRTVPDDLWNAMADTLGEEFADSYLWGATLASGHLLPHTVTAWMKLRDMPAVMKLLKSKSITLDKPKLFPDNGSPSFETVHPHLCDNDDFRAFKRKMAKITGRAPA